MRYGSISVIPTLFRVGIGCNTAEYTLPYADANPPTIYCEVAANCLDVPCKLRVCLGACEYKDDIDGMSCDMRDKSKGVCAAGVCAPIEDQPQCDGPKSACEYDSDCFVRQCTNSICVDGQCVHVPYEDDSRCFDDKEGVIYSGTCSSCACVPKL